MTMYHRSSGRLPLSINVTLIYRGKKVANTHTKNINPFGAFIILPTASLAKDDFVEIHFIDLENKQNQCLQKGLVMHRNKHGVGVLFAYDSGEFRKMLRHKIAVLNQPEDHKSLRQAV
jgi:hypothetical protein